MRRLVLCAAALTACGDAPDYTAAVPYWAQPDSITIGLGRVSDLKAMSRDHVFAADIGAAVIFSVNPSAERYRSIGMGDREPVQVQLPAKLAVASDIGLAAFDAETRAVDLFSADGDHIRSFTPGFIPAMMSFSREPIGMTFAIAEEDSGGARHAVIVRTDMQGNGRDTLLSATHGPEALRMAPAGAGQTSMAPSATGMWVRAPSAPDTVFDVSPRSTRRLLLRAEDESADGMLFDVPGQTLWMIHTDETTGGTTYAAYDARVASASTETRGEGEATPGFLGLRTTDANFTPFAIYDGIVSGFRRIRASGAIALTAYDLNADKFERGSE